MNYFINDCHRGVNSSVVRTLMGALMDWLECAIRRYTIIVRLNAVKPKDLTNLVELKMTLYRTECPWPEIH